jgi:hypothetical protein
MIVRCAPSSRLVRVGDDNFARLPPPSEGLEEVVALGAHSLQTTAGNGSRLQVFVPGAGLARSELCG